MVATGQLKAPSDWQPDNNKLNLAVFGKLQEELGELQSAIARCVIQGIGESHPVTGKYNREWLEEEIADVRAMLQLLTEHFDLTIDRTRTLEKLDHKRAWLKLVIP